MIEIRMHGRGGQGAVIAAKILASALFKEGKYGQSFPSFGVERRGAPVLAFTRIDTKPIRLRCEIYTPDHLVVLDPTLVIHTNVTAGLKPDGTVLINSEKSAAEFGLPETYRVATIDATGIAVEHGLGTKSIPVVNTAILGAFARWTGLVGIDAIVEAIIEGVPARHEANAAAARQAWAVLESTVLSAA
jgi:2-oxoacid:acceptor oxidoreductase gamma subunit (pyruvate/2-ketoisovalerate family)